MIYAELSGGLGNQMFIYAFARAMGLTCHEDVTLIDRRDWKNGAPAHTALALDALAVSPEVKVLADPGFAKAHLPVQNTAKALMIKYEQRKGLMSRDWQPFEAKMAPLLNTLGLHFATEGYTPARRGRARDFLAWGYFQSEEYFVSQAGALRRELTPKESFDPETAALAAKVEHTACPVCLHWRCGDYFKPENAALQVCSPAYYARACKALREKSPDAELFVFSDDLDYVRQNLDPAGLPVHWMDGHRTAAQDLALMRRCRAFIMSNSTFSWWGQWLAQDKTVFAPDRWYTNGKKTALYQENWNLIPTE